jgi:hypothetical protein
MAIQTPRELATRLRQKAVDCENLAKDLPRHRDRLLGTAEHYWQLADEIDQPRTRPGSLTEAFSADVEARRAASGGMPNGTHGACYRKASAAGSA